ncbi:hypothetical protein L6R53_09340 [Myxococcota bacterium]|nr:hypothetical protein [Myxococcota bacterium]
MPSLALLLLARLAPALAQSPPPTDLDGDGKADAIVVEEEGVTIGGQRVACGGMELCSVQLHDIAADDGLREVLVIELGPRDDASARLYRLRKGKLVELSFRKPGDSDEWQSVPSAVSTSGNGIVLADHQGRFYTQRQKYVAKGDTLTHVPQPFWYAGFEVHVDRSVPVVRSPGGTEVVANVKPDSDITVLLESAEQEGWFLVKLSTGLTGWVTLETLAQGSDQVRGVMSAG